MTTITYFAGDVPAAVTWYTKVLGVDPYFSRDFQDKPAYVEFRVGDYQHELGILDRRFAPPAHTDAPAGPLTYWAVIDPFAAARRGA